MTDDNPYTVEEFTAQLYQMLMIKDAFQSISVFYEEGLIEVEMDANFGGQPGSFKITIEQLVEQL